LGEAAAELRVLEHGSQQGFEMVDAARNDSRASMSWPGGDSINMAADRFAKDAGSKKCVQFATGEEKAAGIAGSAHNKR
jgi:hypothetical protein